MKFFHTPPTTDTGTPRKWLPETRGQMKKCPNSRSPPHVHVSVEASNALSEEEVVSQTSGASFSSSSSSSSPAGRRTRSLRGRTGRPAPGVVVFGEDRRPYRCMQPIQVTEHLGVTPGVSATPSNQQLLAIEGSSPGTRRPDGRSPKNAAFLRTKGNQSSHPAKLSID